MINVKTLTHKNRLVLGLGQTGVSVVRFLHANSLPFSVMDSRANPPGKEFVEQFNPKAMRSWNADEFSDFDEIILSPGLSRNLSEIVQAEKNGVRIIGDVELFLEVCSTPVIAITGSNGKSTVTELCTKILNAENIKAEAGGNIGLPALDLLELDCDCVVLELSSFQLETTESLQAAAATILNLSEDHMDRYDSFNDYVNAKKIIYNNAQKIISNAAEPLTHHQNSDIRFGLGSELKQLDWSFDAKRSVLLKAGAEFLNFDECLLQGEHNALNILASLALVEAAGYKVQEKGIEAVKQYQAMPHRCQWVAEKSNITYINDSKATNVGATQAAIEGFSRLYNYKVLIAGGDAKGADLEPLKSSLLHHIDALVCFGQDGKKIAELASAKSYWVKSLEAAVHKAKELCVSSVAKKALVLLSPACASLDMFKNYQERGDKFIEYVEAVA